MLELSTASGWGFGPTPSSERLPHNHGKWGTTGKTTLLATAGVLQRPRTIESVRVGQNKSVYGSRGKGLCGKIPLSQYPWIEAYSQVVGVAPLPAAHITLQDSIMQHQAHVCHGQQCCGHHKVPK